MSNNNLGLYIRKKRKAMGLNQERLAEALHISQGYLTKIETGKQIPSKELFFDMARLFSISSLELFKLLDDGDEEEEQNQSIVNPLANEDEPEYLAFLSVDPNLPENERELMADIIRRRYAEAKRNAEELSKIPPGINRPARIIKPE